MNSLVVRKKNTIHIDHKCLEEEYSTLLGIIHTPLACICIPHILVCVGVHSEESLQNWAGFFFSVFPLNRKNMFLY